MVCISDVYMCMHTHHGDLRLNTAHHHRALFHHVSDDHLLKPHCKANEFIQVTFAALQRLKEVEVRVETSAAEAQQKLKQLASKMPKAL